MVVEKCISKNFVTVCFYNWHDMLFVLNVIFIIEKHVSELINMDSFMLEKSVFTSLASYASKWGLGDQKQVPEST